MSNYGSPPDPADNNNQSGQEPGNGQPDNPYAQPANPYGNGQQPNPYGEGQPNYQSPEWTQPPADQQGAKLPPPGGGYGGPSQPPAGAYGAPPQPQPGMYGGPQQPLAYGGPMMHVPDGMHVDQATGMVIPNGTEVASVGRRIGAYFLGALLAIVTLGIGYIIWGLIEWSNGRTPVQRVLGMRCYKSPEARTFGWGDMFLREFVYFACSIIGIVQIANFIVFLANSKRQGFHDMASGCTVLHDPNKVLG